MTDERTLNPSAPAWGEPGARFVVTTASGSRHEFMWSEGVVYRRYVDETNVVEWGDQPPPEGHYGQRLRRDGEWLPVLGDLPEPVIGERYIFAVAGLNPLADWTWRETTPVTAVEPLSSARLRVPAEVARESDPAAAEPRDE